MKRMLFNATQPEELRVAIVDGQKLIDSTSNPRKGTAQGQHLQGRHHPRRALARSRFVDYGEDRHGFLPFKEISRTYFREARDAGRRASRTRSAKARN